MKQNLWCPHFLNLYQTDLEARVTTSEDHADTELTDRSKSTYTFFTHFIHQMFLSGMLQLLHGNNSISYMVTYSEVFLLNYTVTYKHSDTRQIGKKENVEAKRKFLLCTLQNIHYKFESVTRIHQLCVPVGKGWDPGLKIMGLPLWQRCQSSFSQWQHTDAACRVTAHHPHVAAADTNSSASSLSISHFYSPRIIMSHWMCSWAPALVWIIPRWEEGLVYLNVGTVSHTWMQVNDQWTSVCWFVVRFKGSTTHVFAINSSMLNSTQSKDANLLCNRKQIFYLPLRSHRMEVNRRPIFFNVNFASVHLLCSWTFTWSKTPKRLMQPTVLAQLH